MAETDSIASRMQKLAKLKRLKAGQQNVAETEALATDEESVFAMPGPVEESAHGPELGTDRDEPSFAPQLGGVDDSVERPSEPVAEQAEATRDSYPAAKTEDREDDSLSSYFAALGIAPEEAEENPAETEATEPSLDIEDEPLDLLELEEVDGDEPEIETPDFAAAEVDPETIAREFENEEPAPVRDRTTAETDDNRITVVFDESRTTLLNHVSRQMNCSVDDVVVTALDWYLDALFGEDEAKAG